MLIQPKQISKNIRKDDSTQNISRDRIIEKGLIRKANIAKVNKVLSNLKQEQLTFNECLEYINKLDSENAMPGLSHFGLDQEKLKLISKVNNIYFVHILVALICGLLIFIADISNNTAPSLTCIIFPLIYFQSIRFISKIFSLPYKDETFYSIKANYQLYENVLHLHGLKMEELRIIRQKEAQLARMRTKNYWFSMDGHRFEKEMGKLYEKLGYCVTVTPESGDGGIDLLLKKDGITSIVQCKAYKQPVPPEPVRALWGVRGDFRADEVILIALSGVTKAGLEFIKARGGRYKILDINDVIEMTMKVGISAVDSFSIPEETVYYGDNLRVVLLSAGNNKIKVLQEIKDMTGFSIQAVKELIDNAPQTIFENLNHMQAETVKTRLEFAGASVRIS